MFFIRLLCTWLYIKTFLLAMYISDGENSMYFISEMCKRYTFRISLYLYIFHKVKKKKEKEKKIDNTDNKQKDIKCSVFVDSKI